ncbi:MAG: hypothetical protein JNL42_13385 [Anaerolineae bacterium]|nr:hypothetical protein [Anaerolineae bacterium]
MAGMFGFKLSEEHLATIVQWRASIEPFVRAFVAQKFNLDYLLHDVIGAKSNIWTSDGGDHVALVYPVGEDEWSMSLSLCPGLYPPLTLELEGGIKTITSYDHVDLPRDHDELSRVRFLLGQLGIAHEGYAHLLRLGWTLAQARQYEYYLHPSGISSSGRVRRIGSVQWVTLESIPPDLL